MIPGGPRAAIKVGARVHAIFEKETANFTLVKWGLDEEKAVQGASA